MEGFLASKVLRQKDEVLVASFSGAGKQIGLYFSAHWCPPCRGFTPVLAEWYKAIKASGKADNFEVVFVTCDRDQKSFDDYYDTMPWTAIAFDNEIRKELGDICGVSGIPAFIIIDGATGEIKTKEGRSIVSKDPKGENFSLVE